MLQLFLGQIPEAIFFALFMIYAKGIKEKRILFTILMVVEYLLLIYSFPFNWFFHIGYVITTFLTLKFLYKQKAQITDIFILMVAYLVLAITSVIPYFIIWKTINNYLIYVIINRILIFGIVFGFNKKLYNIQKLYKNLWNRNDKNKRKIKSTTFRAVNIVIFNILFYIINLCMAFAIFIKEMWKMFHLTKL